jgi:hypothetical protein
MDKLGEVNVEIGVAVQNEIAKAFRQSAMFEDWLRVLNDEWVKYGLGIVTGAAAGGGGGVYLIDERSDKTTVYFSLFADAYREGLKHYVQRVQEGKPNE